MSTRDPSPRPVYVLRVQPERDGDAGDRDLRAAVKRLLRALRLRCLDIREEHE
jgi:hypothetical protein